MIVPVLLVSLIESLFILTAHLAVDKPERPWLAWLSRPQQIVNSRLEFFVQGKFRNFLKAGISRPGILFASALFLLLITIGGIAGGLLGFSFTPTIESDTVIAQATLPYGTPRQKSVAVQQVLVEAANIVLHDNNMESPGMFSLIGTRLEEGEVEVETLTGSHYISVLTALLSEAERTLSGPEFAEAWRNAFGKPDELEALNFTGETNVTGGEPVMLEVFHHDPAVARKAALSLGERLRTIAGLSSVDDGVRVGKPELKICLKDRGLRMGLTATNVAEQIRQRYHGLEALRFVRDGNEVKVMVRLSEKERKHPGTLQEVLLQSPSGVLIPFTEVVDISQTHSFTSMARRDGKRNYPVTADISFGISDDVVEEALEEKILPELIADSPGVSVSFGGEEEEEDDSLYALWNGFLVVLAVIYLLSAFHFNSYTQPLFVLAVIPFSFIGAIWGHILLGYDLSIISVIGIIAMTGVVVNDSLVLTTTYNRCRNDGMDHHRAV